MYYKIIALHSIGKKIVLHYFDYHNHRNADLLKDYCVEICSYRRKNLFSSFSLSAPYIVSSRINTLLIKRLNVDTHPILLEGLHCSGILPFLNDSKRVVLRMHNDEVNYYKSLGKMENNLFRRFYFSAETTLITKYQKKLNTGIRAACLSESDIEVLRTEYGFSDLHFIPCFIPWQAGNSLKGKGDYCLYHGNLSISENETAALWLLKNVFNKADVPFVIAGKGISQNLRMTAKKIKNCRLIDNPPVDELNSLIRDAHIHILPSQNNTGVKLKLLHALCEGRFCITNNNGIKGSHIHSGVHIANTAEEYIVLLKQLFNQEFTEDDFMERTYIQTIYNNALNARKLSALW